MKLENLDEITHKTLFLSQRIFISFFVEVFIEIFLFIFKLFFTFVSHSEKLFLTIFMSCYILVTSFHIYINIGQSENSIYDTFFNLKKKFIWTLDFVWAFLSLFCTRNYNFIKLCLHSHFLVNLRYFNRDVSQSSFNQKNFHLFSSRFFLRLYRP